MKLTKAEQRIVAWMRDGDRALYKCYYDDRKYGWHESAGSKSKTVFHKIATRKQVLSLIAKGVIEWYACYPEDLRAMLVENRRPGEGSGGEPMEVAA